MLSCVSLYVGLLQIMTRVLLRNMPRFPDVKVLMVIGFPEQQWVRPGFGHAVKLARYCM